MPKVTKTLGNNKARACESLGFAQKRGGASFDTSPFIFNFSYPKSCGHKAGFTDVNELSDSFRFGIVFR